ncbi:hypothetical protein F5146DRAFT_1005359 [Armillaria mellea]|nr:hypothetical protein F5146DRAFT_1005359 [Armillaria mellea]
MRERSPANISSSYNLPKLGNDVNDTCRSVFLEVVLEDNSEDVTAHQKQSNDSHISDRQSAIYKEMNVILEKLLALKNDKNSIHIPEIDAYHKAFEEFKRIEKDLSHYKKASGSSATPHRLAYRSNDNDTRKSHLVLGWDRNSDKDAATSANKSNHDSPVPVTLPTTREGNTQPRIAKKLVTGSHNNIGRKTITLPLQFKRHKADSDESEPQHEQSTMKDILPDFLELMNCILKQQAPQLSSQVRSVEKKRAGPFKDHVSSKKHLPKEKWILKEVCRLCWKYLDIKNGPDIVLNGTGASPEEVVEYESGGPTPLVNPMWPDWCSLKSHWNLDLAEAFYVQFSKDAKNSKEYEFSKNNILVAFENKLKPTQHHLMTILTVQLRDVRLEIAGNNMDLGHDRVNPEWRREGISSDESDAEGGPYIVKRRTWRSKELTQLLDITNSSYDQKNVYGNPHPGNRPHLLTDIEKQLLQPEPEMALPAFTED